MECILFQIFFTFEDVFILVTSFHIPVVLLSIAVAVLKATSAKLHLKGTELTGWYALKLLTANSLMFMRTLQNFNIMKAVQMERLNP